MPPNLQGHAKNFFTQNQPMILQGSMSYKIMSITYLATNIVKQFSEKVNTYSLS